MEDPTSLTPALSGPDRLSVCDREPIHTPGAIQPHGLLLVAEANSLGVVAAAGDVDGRLAADWRGRDLASLLGRDVAGLLRAAPPAGAVRVGRVEGRSETFEALLHRSDRGILVELEPAGAPMAAADILARLDAAATTFERAPDLGSLCAEAAQVFRQITGFDRVMIYQFHDDEAGVVLAEAKEPEMGSFLNHHFPGGDVPRQARALYVRNRVRVIPEVAYEPAPLRAADSGHAPGDLNPGDLNLGDLDMSDLGLRSVSPIHVQYLKNMGVGASASVSIVKDGQLWGLVACHHRTARLLPFELRLACQSLAGHLARQVRAKMDAVLYRERIRLRAAEDALADALAGENAMEDVLDRHGDDLRRALGADGFAAVAGPKLVTKGRCPDGEAVREIAWWVETQVRVRAFATHALSEHLPAASGEVGALASGLLAITVPGEEPVALLWFRAEQVEVVNWAGNPHKSSQEDPQAELTPRASFAAWSETVRGQSRRWTLVETEAAQRLAHTLLQARQQRRIRELNRQLSATVVENERLLQHKDHLMHEVNHRVQNSLQLVASFLRLQARSLADAPARDALAEAERRIAAVGLVHRQLYGGDQVETVDLSRYLLELSHEVTNSLGAEWREQLMLDLAPVLIAADRAVRLGLILTELVLNTAKYAYRGAPGPLILVLDQNRDRFRLVVADRGAGKAGTRQGFGTIILNAMVQSLNGTLEDLDNAPGVRTVVTAPIGLR